MNIIDNNSTYIQRSNYFYIQQHYKVITLRLFWKTHKIMKLLIPFRVLSISKEVTIEEARFLQLLGNTSNYRALRL